MRKHDILCVYVRETERIRLKSKLRKRKKDLSFMGAIESSFAAQAKGYSTNALKYNIKKLYIQCLNDKVIRVWNT